MAKSSMSLQPYLNFMGTQKVGLGSLTLIGGKGHGIRHPFDSHIDNLEGEI